MSSKGGTELESSIDHALKRHDFHPLEGLLQNEPSSQKCSKQLTGKIHRLMCQEIERQDVKNISFLLNVIHKFGKYMNTSGEEWLSAALKQGLIEKMIFWFDKIRGILAYGGKEKNESLLNLTEDFFDVVMTIANHSNDGKMQVLEHFTARTCSLISDTAIHVLIKQEAVHKLNLMLGMIPRDARKAILHSERVLSIMPSMGKGILDAGDYDLQVAITEALCRMTSEKQRGELASQWFPMEFITDAFTAIKDSEFETDCRKFLNLVNGMLGDKRRVCTYPCLSAYLDEHKLQIPSDEKLEEFWIDFNISTESISFYVSTEEDEDHQWETVCVTESEVNVYSIQGTENKLVLTINLNNPTTISKKKGSQLQIHFDAILDIADVARRVYGVNKLKGYTMKNRCSMGKTAVHIIFEDSTSQSVVPESQCSVYSIKSAEGTNRSEANAKKLCMSTSSVNQRNEEREHPIDHSKLVTPSKKVCEARMIIPVTNIHKLAKPPALTDTPIKQKMKVKPPLEMVSSAERSTVSRSSINKKGSKPIDKTAQKVILGKGEVMVDDYVQSLDGDEKAEIVPDTQPMSRRDTEILTTVSHLSEHKPDSIRTQTSSRSGKTKISVTNEYICNKEPITECKSHIGQRNTERKKHGNDGHDQSLKPEASVKPTECHINKEVSRIGAQNRVLCDNTGTGTNRNVSALSNQAKYPPAKAKGGVKEKHENENVTQSLISKIGSKYSQAFTLKKPGEMTLANLNKFKLQANQDKSNDKSSRRLQKAKQFNVSAEKDDIYSFYFRGSDDPIIHLGVSSNVSLKENNTKPSIAERKSTKNNEKDVTDDKKKCKDYHHKHLFSDTDTDRGGDESKTDRSWLRNQSSVKKPKIVTYGRQKHKKAAEEASQSKQKVISKTKPKDRRKANQEPLEVTANRRTQNTGVEKTTNKRTRRAAQIRKNYKDLSHSEPESAEDTAPPPPTTYKAHTTPPCLAAEKKKRPEKPNTARLQKSQESIEPKTTNKKTEASSRLAQGLEQVTLSPSPPSIEKNRSDGFASNNEFNSAIMRSSSPSLCASSPEKQTPLSKHIPTNIFYSTELRTWSRQPAKPADKPFSSQEKAKSTDRGAGNKSGSPASSNESMPSSSTGIQDESAISGFVTLPTAKKRAEKGGSEHTGRTSTSGSDKLLPNPDLYKQSRIQVSSPTSGGSDSSSRRIMNFEMFKNNSNKSGPLGSSRKRMLDGSHYISPKGSEDQIKRRKAKLSPRKLFVKATEDDLTNRDSKSLSTVSGNDLSSGAAETWDGASSNVGVMCQQIGKEFNRKVQTHSRKMDHYTKQSLKSTGKHIASVSVQIQESRIKRLDRLQGAILEEIEDFEKDSVALKNLEKEFTNFWTQQMQAFHLFRKNEQKRIQNLRSLLEKNVYQSIEHEETIFNSEMTLMKENMKHMQERLLKEMQEEELLNVRRGLQSLFMTGARFF